MNGKVAAIVLVISALAAGAGVFYTQNFAYYHPVKESRQATIRMVAAGTGDVRELPVRDMKAIEKTSSPLGYRACFVVPNSLAMLSETYAVADAEPLEAPGWFDCFDADEIGLALEEGRALAFLSERDIADGVDRVVAVMDDGRGFSWNHLNEKYKD